MSIKYVIKDSRAIVPTKAHSTDIGYDLTVIDVYKKISPKITLFETGISLSPPEGFYIEIVPRSSMSKTGYTMPNSFGVIDPSYRGTLKVALIKVDESLPDIELPFTRCQLVLRKAEYAKMVQVEALDETTRGSGGFGSTDSKHKYSSNPVKKEVKKKLERKEFDTSILKYLSRNDSIKVSDLYKSPELIKGDPSDIINIDMSKVRKIIGNKEEYQKCYQDMKETIHNKMNKMNKILREQGITEEEENEKEPLDDQTEQPE